MRLIPITVLSNPDFNLVPDILKASICIRDGMDEQEIVRHMDDTPCTLFTEVHG